MLKTMSGRAARSRAGKSAVASRRITSPQAARARATASMVSGASHSAYSSSMDAPAGGAPGVSGAAAPPPAASAQRKGIGGCGMGWPRRAS
jgi:hypothetical protein